MKNTCLQVALAQCVSCTPSKYPHQDVTGNHASAGEALVVDEKSHLLISNSTISWMKKCVCSILSTGGCGIFIEKTQLAEAVNTNPSWNDLSFVLQEIEKWAQDSEPEHVSNLYKSNGQETSVLNPNKLVNYLQNVLKKCFLNSK